MSVDTTRTRLDKLQARWSLFLAIGNGAALTAFGTKVLDTLASCQAVNAERVVAMTFVPMVFFTAGLIFAAIIPLIELLNAQRRLRAYYSDSSKDLSQRDALVAGDDYWDDIKNWWPEICSAMCFAAGLFSVLIILVKQFRFADLSF